MVLQKLSARFLWEMLVFIQFSRCKGWFPPIYFRNYTYINLLKYLLVWLTIFDTKISIKRTSGDYFPLNQFITNQLLYRILSLTLLLLKPLPCLIAGSTYLDRVPNFFRLYAWSGFNSNCTHITITTKSPSSNLVY